MQYELPDPPEGMEYLVISIPVRTDTEWDDALVEPVAKLAADGARRAVRQRTEVSA
jgi:hypothetical protein